MRRGVGVRFSRADFPQEMAMRGRVCVGLPSREASANAVGAHVDERGRASDKTVCIALLLGWQVG